MRLWDRGRGREGAGKGQGKGCKEGLREKGVGGVMAVWLVGWLLVLGTVLYANACVWV